MNAVTLTIIEIAIGILIEGVILSMVFAYISNQASEKQYTHLKDEMANIETQNKFEFQQTLNAIEKAKTEIINQIKESNYLKGSDKS